MKKYDHDFYTLEEAAELFDCTIDDFLKWGAAGKVKLHVWYEGNLYNSHGYSDRKYIKKTLAETVAIPSGEIMDVWKNQISYQFSYNTRKMKIITSSGETGFIDLTFRLHDLFVMADELKTFAPQGFSQESHLSKILDPTHPWHSENLAMAVNAWLELYANREGNRNDSTFKPVGGNTRLIDEWLEKKNPNIGNTTKDHFRVIINPDKRGGPNKLSE